MTQKFQVGQRIKVVALSGSNNPRYQGELGKEYDVLGLDDCGDPIIILGERYGPYASDCELVEEPKQEPTPLPPVVTYLEINGDTVKTLIRAHLKDMFKIDQEIEAFRLWPTGEFEVEFKRP